MPSNARGMNPKESLLAVNLRTGLNQTRDFR